MARAIELVETGDSAMDLCRDTSDPKTMRAIAEKTLGSGDFAFAANEIMGRLGPEAGALCCSNREKPAHRKSADRLVALARHAGAWPDVAKRAAQLNAPALIDVLLRPAGLSDAERSDLSSVLLGLGQPEITQKVMAATLSNAVEWSAASIDLGLLSANAATRREAMGQMVARSELACLPRLGEYLCGDTPGRLHPRSHLLAADAMTRLGELGIQALAAIARVLASRSMFSDRVRLGLLGRALHRHRSAEPIRLLLADPAFGRIRRAVFLWKVIAWIRVEKV